MTTHRHKSHLVRNAASLINLCCNSVIIAIGCFLSFLIHFPGQVLVAIFHLDLEEWEVDSFDYHIAFFFCTIVVDSAAAIGYHRISNWYLMLSLAVVAIILTLFTVVILLVHGIGYVDDTWQDFVDRRGYSD